MVVSERKDPLEVEADTLLANLPPEQRPGILLPEQVRRRRRRECPLAPVLALREGGAAATPDPEFVFAEWEICERILEAANLLEGERTVFVLHSQHGMADTEIARVTGLRREAVRLRRKRAQEKLRRVFEPTNRDAA